MKTKALLLVLSVLLSGAAFSNTPFLKLPTDAIQTKRMVIKKTGKQTNLYFPVAAEATYNANPYFNKSKAETWKSYTLDLAGNGSANLLATVGDTLILEDAGVYYVLSLSGDKLVKNQLKFLNQDNQEISPLAIMDNLMMSTNGVYSLDNVDENFNVTVTQILDNTVDFGTSSYSTMNNVEVLGDYVYMIDGSEVFIVNKNTQTLEKTVYPVHASIEGTAQYTENGETFVVVVYNDVASHFVKIKDDGSYEEIGLANSTQDGSPILIHSLDDNGSGDVYGVGSYVDLSTFSSVRVLYKLEMKDGEIIFNSVSDVDISSMNAGVAKIATSGD